MNVTHETYKKLALIDHAVAKKRKVRFYFAWRTAFLRVQQDQEAKIHGVQRLLKLVGLRTDLQIRNKLCRWRDFVELRQYQGESLGSVLARYAKREARRAFVKWLANVKSDQMKERHETVSALVTTMGFKQRVFLAMKHAVMLSKAERVTERFQEWRVRCA